MRFFDIAAAWCRALMAALFVPVPWRVLMWLPGPSPNIVQYAARGVQSSYRPHNVGTLSAYSVCVSS